jgi:hypothetical protein
VAVSTSGNTFYVDYERVRKHMGSTYYWYLVDYITPNKYGELSAKNYIQGDCILFRIRYLSGSAHQRPIDAGAGKVFPAKNTQWEYPPPNTIMEDMLKSVCSR